MRSRTASPDRVLINGIYAMQQMSGQQRYAAGIVELLDPSRITLVTPNPSRVDSSWRRHLWTNARYLSERGSASLFFTHQFPWYRSRTKVEIITVHDLFPITNPEWYSRAYGSYASQLLRRGIARADILLTVSDVTANQIRARFAPRASIHVVPSAPGGIFFEPRQGSDDEVLVRFGVTAGNYLAALASSDPRKRLDLITQAHALSEHRDMPLVVAGSAPAIVARSAAGVADAANTLVTGWITDGDLAVLYRNAGAFIAASDAEGFGLPVVEAATAGAPVIASNLPVHRWTLGDYAHYFETGSAESLASAIDAVFFGSPRAAFDRRFSFPASAAKVEKVIDELWP
jgi:glycosyltransferase involved in cell wall biosynthesis